MHNRFCGLLLIFLLFFALEAFAADIQVTPIKLLFESGQKTGTITVKNNADQKLNMQISVFSWEQDAEGKDEYKPSEEVVLFPKILTIGGKTEQIIRVGVRVPKGQRERTFRVYFEELPELQKTEKEGAALKTLLRIGVPIFIAPVKSVKAGSIEGLELKGGNAAFVIKNTGNTHLTITGAKVEGHDASGSVVFTKDLGWRYIHGGRIKQFSVGIPKEECLKAKALKVTVSADKLALEKGLDVSPEICPQ